MRHFKKIAKEAHSLRVEFENRRKIGLNESLKNPWAEQEDEDILEFHENDLTEGTSFLPETSEMWLSRHGLKAKHLDFYQASLLDCFLRIKRTNQLDVHWLILNEARHT